MKTLIIGMGNVGVMHGWLLSQGGAEIVHMVRKGSLDKYSGGVTMDVLDLRGESPGNDTTTYRPDITDHLTSGEDYELVMVATNHHQAAGAVRQYRDFVPKADFLIFTANWDGTGEIGWLWVHHATDAGLIGAALYMAGLPGGDAGIDIWLLMVRAVRDALAVLEKRGVDARSYPDPGPFLIPDETEAAAGLRQAILSLPHYERTREA